MLIERAKDIEKCYKGFLVSEVNSVLDGILLVQNVRKSPYIHLNENSYVIMMKTQYSKVMLKFESLPLRLR